MSRSRSSDCATASQAVVVAYETGLAAPGRPLLVTSPDRGALRVGNFRKRIFDRAGKPA
jgi:hypothetical protein